MFSKKQNLRKKGRKVFTITFFATNYLLYNKTKIWERIQFDPSKAGASSIGSRAQVLNVRLGKGYMYIVYVDAIRFNLDYCMYVCIVPMWNKHAQRIIRSGQPFIFHTKNKN